MPKNKTHSGAKKRFRITGTGKVMRQQAGLRHLLEVKSGKEARGPVGATSWCPPPTPRRPSGCSASELTVLPRLVRRPARRAEPNQGDSFTWHA